ncbi:peptidyl-tRNA hydrolase 2, mitochondrial [Caerostris darwini]|uniref:peptidyl-tRNA hydrolase n=1 Tax=Caerostris darwini TaxID=1538125 RepID=A0AAV4VQI4_9ARAC|nr:peptidyl-tRNA hydrolase 2, mitochondrial [Caerostris darwini]
MRGLRASGAGGTGSSAKSVELDMGLVEMEIGGLLTRVAAPLGCFLTRCFGGNLNPSLSVSLLKNENLGDYKLVLVVRDDLKMGQGKIAAQCSHASVMAYKYATSYDPEVARLWETFAQAKVVLKVSNEKDLLNLYEAAKKYGLSASLVCDSGRTQVDPGSKTVIAIGPGASQVINKITGHLKLL